jgi:hypothetical protein
LVVNTILCGGGTVEKLGILLGASSRAAAGKPGNTRLHRILRVLEEDPAVSYILDSEYRFIYTNPAWDSFAVSNGAPQLGGEAIIGFKIFDAITSVLKPVYANAFRRATETAAISQLTYICSSPEKKRQFRMKIYFMERRNWFLVTNSLLAEHPHRKSRHADQEAYFDRGIITMCAHCRCSKRIDGSNLWDFVPDYLRLQGLQALKVSHALCPVCQEHFYPHLEPAD